jgi:hypothetical protein
LLCVAGVTLPLLCIHEPTSARLCLSCAGP